MLPRLKYRYSAFNDQFCAKEYSSPPPTVQPARVVEASPTDTAVIGGKLVKIGDTFDSCTVVLDVILPYAKPPVTKTSKGPTGTYPIRPLSVPKYCNRWSAVT